MVVYTSRKKFPFIWFTFYRDARLEQRQPQDIHHLILAFQVDGGDAPGAQVRRRRFGFGAQIIVNLQRASHVLQRPLGEDRHPFRGQVVFEPRPVQVGYLDIPAVDQALDVPVDAAHRDAQTRRQPRLGHHRVFGNGVHKLIFLIFHVGPGLRIHFLNSHMKAPTCQDVNQPEISHLHDIGLKIAQFG